MPLAARRGQAVDPIHEDNGIEMNPGPFHAERRFVLRSFTDDPRQREDHLARAALAAVGTEDDVGNRALISERRAQKRRSRRQRTELPCLWLLARTNNFPGNLPRVTPIGDEAPNRRRARQSRLATAAPLGCG
jgi:hypothetical protein